MKIITAESAGFCFGVKRAMEIAFSCANTEETIFSLGPLIHNEQVVLRLKDSGIIPAESIDDIPDGSKVIIRTHGIPKKDYETLKAKHAEIIDATCPFVKKIHKIVSDNHENGYNIVIAGDSAHPEVIGINGWCDNSAVIIKNEDEVLSLDSEKRYCFVAQTTFSAKIWKKIKKNIKNTCKTPLVFDTICSATDERQTEADKISKEVDIMLVIGGKHSSNTLKLADICRGNCDETYHIETVKELPKAVFYRPVIGVTAGASTPDWIIKEVINNMSEEKMVDTELNFAEELEKSMVSLRTGDIVKGTVIGITPTEVYVNLGFKADGVIPAGELTDDDSLTPEDIVKIGDVIDVFVVRVNDVEGTVKLSKKKIDSIAGYKKVEDALESQEILEGKIIEAVNGGLIVLTNGVRVFVPASQSATRRGDDLSELVGTTTQLRIIEISRNRRKIVGSIKSVASEIRAKKLEEFWATAEVGKEYEGTVKSLTSFGAFVDIGGIDGLVHISELSWGRIKHPSEVVNVGDKITVYIIALDKEKNKISLGYKKASENPWEIVKNTIHVGDVVRVKVVRIVPFGAFAEVIPYVDGLIHISQISTERIDKVASALSIGESVDAKVIAIDLENKKISLSIRALLEPETYVMPDEAPEAETAEEAAPETDAE